MPPFLLLSPRCFKLDARQHLGLPVLALDHLHRRAHVLFESIDVGAVLKPEGRVGMTQALDVALSALAVAVKAEIIQPPHSRTSLYAGQARI